MIEAVVGLLMFINGEIKEARLQDSMAMCLRGKREAERTFSESVTYKCWKGKAELEDNIDQNRLRNSLSNKVAKHLRDRRYRQIVIKNKKAYDRKKFQNNSRDS
jgi:hypothetical protein